MTTPSAVYAPATGSQRQARVPGSRLSREAAALDDADDVSASGPGGHARPIMCFQPHRCGTLRRRRSFLERSGYPAEASSDGLSPVEHGLTGLEHKRRELRRSPRMFLHVCWFLGVATTARDSTRVCT